MTPLSAHRLLQQAQRRVLTNEEMDHVIDGLYGPKTWTATEFAVARSEVKPAAFVTLLKSCGIDVRGIKTS